MWRKRKSYDRFYDIEGRSLVSVTTVLNIVAKPALAPWYAREERKLVLSALREILPVGVPMDGASPQYDDFVQMVEDKAGELKAGDKSKQDAARRGKTQHTAIERALKGADLPEMDKMDRKYFDAWWTWWKSTGFEVIEAEKVVYSLFHGYAGTLDVLAKHPKRGIVVLDWKRGKRIYKEHFLQNVAYRAALREMGIHTDLGALVRLTTTRPEIKLVDDTEHTMHDFVAALTLWRWGHKHDSKAE